MDDQTPSKTLRIPPAPDPLLHGDSVVGATFTAPGSSSGRGWQAPTPEELQVYFSQYEIRRILGRGGMGVVYEAWQMRLARMVAIKVLPADVEDDGMNYAERFKQEGRAMAKFRHPGIVAVYEAGETRDGLLYLVMECIEGTDVAQLVATQGKLAVAQALGITSRVCEALSYAHSQGVVHRDIKPSNVIIEANGSVKVADFGLAKFSGPDGSHYTTSNVSIGTPDFMSPEALEGTGRVDHRADIYAVGGMLYQMLTGKVPHGRFAPPSALVLGLDKRLDRIVEKAMQSDPAQRYATAAEMLAEIAKIPCANGNLIAGRTSDTAKANRQPRVKLILVSIVFAALIGIVARGYSVWKNAHLGTPASEQSASETAAADEIRHRWRAVPSKHDAPMDHGAVHLQHYETWGAPSFRIANVGIRATIAWQPNPPGRNELIKVTARWTETEHYYACLYGATVELGYYRAPGVTALQRWSVVPPPEPGEAINLQLACVGNRLAVWVRDRLVGVLEDGVVTAQANVGVQAVDGHIQSLEYLDLDGLSDEESFRRLGLNATGSAAIEGGGTTPATGTKDEPFVNTLGMKFVPVPIIGGPTDNQSVLFSIWETRVRDYEVFANETKREWPKPKFTQDPTHPAVRVSWNDAQAFCAWLTERERKAGRLGTGERYRLPTDHEWSCAVGIGDREDPAKGPVGNNGSFPTVFPWGTAWPPPLGGGNYSGEEAIGHEMAKDQKVIAGYRDGYQETAPVGSFAANHQGIFDLGGNAWEWCEDLWKPGDVSRVVRGASFASARREGLISSYRDFNAPESHLSSFSFRVVIAGSTSAPRAAADNAPPGATTPAVASRWRDAFAESPLKQIIAKADQTPKGYRLPSGNHWQISPQPQRSGAVRIRGTDEAEKFASLYIIHDDGESERVRFLARNGDWLLSTGKNGRDETDIAAKRATPPNDGHAHELLFARTGGRLITALDGKLLHDEADPSLLPGTFMLDIYADASVCLESVEYLDLDGVSESEALALLGIGKK